MSYEPAQLLTLAQAYAQSIERSLTTVGRRALGHNTFFERIKNGRGCHSHTAARASAFFDQHADASWWPADVPMPLPLDHPNGKDKE